MKLTKTKTKEFFKLIKNENIDTYDECVAMLNDYPELTNEIVSGMSKGTDGCSSLMLAVNYHKFKFALELIKNGADVNFIDNSPHRTDYCPIFICLLERLRNCIVFENTISIAEGIKVWELMESNGLDYSLKSIVTDGINKPENCIEAYIRFVTVGYEYKHKIHEEIKKDPYFLTYQYSEQSREISKEKLYESIMEKLVSCIDEELFMEIDANKHRNSGNLYKIEHEKFIIIDYFSVEIANKYLSKKFGRSIKNIDDNTFIEWHKLYARTIVLL